jgi:hypothetical protein
MAPSKIDSFKGRGDRIFWADATGDTLAEVFTPAGSYFVPSYDVLDPIATLHKSELVRALRNPFVVLFWGSHPDENNDDCFSGEDFSSIESAVEAFQSECFEQGIAYVELDGPGVHQIRKNPHHQARKRDLYDAEWRSERAMQAGMGLGVEAYNDEIGS